MTQRYMRVSTSRTITSIIYLVYDAGQTKCPFNLSFITDKNENTLFHRPKINF